MATKKAPGRKVDMAHVLWVERQRAALTAVVAGMLDGRVSREGPPFAELEAAMDGLVEAAGGVEGYRVVR